jgi:signal transduction histidine kinase
VDVRLAATLVAIFTPLVAVVLFCLYAFAADELLELVQMELQERLAQLEAALQQPDTSRRAVELSILGEQLARDSGGFTVRDAAGRPLASGGSAPEVDDPERADLAPTATSITRADSLRAWRRLTSGETLEVTIGSASFIQERDEILEGFWISLALGIALVAVASVPATRRALRPLRRATRMASTIDLKRLDARLPSRGTSDDVDRHADAVNQLLDRIEVGFERNRRFSQDVAHELRTPVNRVVNVVEVALLEASHSERDRAALASIRDSAGAMARLIDGLLLLALSEGERLAVDFARVEIRDLFRILEEMYEPACEELGLKLEVRPLAGAVRGDMALLLRAVGNLIDNAMTHTPTGGVIQLRASVDTKKASDLLIEVIDTGPGIPDAERDKIFERFVRLDEARGAGGFGLGLAITRTLVRLHEGDVNLLGTEPGGARFVVRLPALTLTC